VIFPQCVGTRRFAVPGTCCQVPDSHHASYDARVKAVQDGGDGHTQGSSANRQVNVRRVLGSLQAI
jgi:hypothetical protein